MWRSSSVVSLSGLVEPLDSSRLTEQGDSEAVGEGVFLPVSTLRKERFLEIQQPIDEASLSPVDSDKPAFLYQIPFSFVIPDQLPVQSCQHIGDGCGENCGHLMLPPTLGKDPSWKNWFSLDDMDMSIVYSVQAQVKSEHARKENPKEPWNFAFKSIPVIPKYNTVAQGDAPVIPELPTHPSRPIDAFQWASWKGPLSARAWILRPIELRLLRHNKPEYSASLIQVELEFQVEPTRPESPPSLRHISRKLITHTITHSMPLQLILTGPVNQSQQEINSRTVSLGKMDTSSVKFQPQIEHHADPNEGDYSPNWSNDYLCSTPPNKVCYTTSIQVPLILPENKTFLPSFESCMISRSYEVEIGIHYSSGWKGLGTSSLNIQLPLQIVS